MRPELLFEAAIWLSLLVYALSGGADFGGGVWDLLASGPRAGRQRAVIADAIAPIWEANHVWIIVVIVLLFTGFPAVFAAAATALHVPLTVMLVGIVLRGSAFVFRAYARPGEAAYRRWSLVFAGASVVAPFMAGACVGAAAAGSIRVSGGTVTSGYWTWAAAFPLSVGLFTLALFAFLAAAYLVHETPDPELKQDFRRKAFAAGLAAGALAWLCLALSAGGAPGLHRGLSARPWSVPFHAATAAVALGALAALRRRLDGLSRGLAVAEVAFVLLGWALAQYPYALPPDLLLRDAASPPAVLGPTLAVLGTGAVLVLPAFAWLYAVFKRRALSE